MGSKETMLLAKLGGKKPKDLTATTMKELPVSTTVDIEDEKVPTTTGMKELEVPSAKMGGSLGILKATKASSPKFPTASAMVDLPVYKSDPMKDLEVSKAKNMPYSPIKNYLKKGK